MTKYRIIANPVAGHGNGAKAIPIIEESLTAHKLDYSLVRTERVGHAIELARAAALEGMDVVVASGGDGTVNEVINGLMAARAEGKTAALGVLPAGRGNDFSYCKGIPEDIESACKVLLSDQRRKVDIGLIRGGKLKGKRYFGNVLGVGFDAITTIEVSKMPRWGGFLSFLVAVIKTIFLYYKGPTVKVDYDDKSLTLPTLLVAVMNGRRLGDGFYMAPEGKADDGKFDLVIAREVTRRRIFTLIPHFMKGTQATQPEITSVQAAKVTITAQKGVLPAETDGEILCTDGDWLQVEILPRAIDLVCDEALFA
jgi:YegS/Rv2252/BmrU family lipid kinase